MSLYEPDYLSQFHAIVAACERYPHTVKLRRTGQVLTLYSINSMFYIDIQNMFYVLNEIFGTTVPSAITDYVKKIVFTEAICVEDESGAQEKELICISFIDNNTLLKFHNWLLDYFSVANDDERLFQRIHMSTPAPRFYDADYYTQGEGLPDKKIDGIFSFGGWPSEEQDDIAKMAPDGCYATKPYSPSSAYRPRGKHMPSRKEPSYERPFVCEYHECKRAFKRLEHLKRHQKMHTGERPYKCLFPGCHKSFSRSDNLNSHYKTHNVARRRPFPSFEYGKSFESI